MAKSSLAKQFLPPASDRDRSYKFFAIFSLILVAIASVFFLLHIILQHTNGRKFRNNRIQLDLSNIPQIILEEDAELTRARNENCSIWDCFNVYKCGQRDQERIAIYVYPLQDYVNSQGTTAFTLTMEFYYILNAIIESPYYTPNPSEACIFVPSIDILNQNNVQRNLVAKALAALPQ